MTTRVRSSIQMCILNYNLSIVCFHLIKIILGNVICSIQRCFYVKTTKKYQSIWQTAAILESDIFSCCYDVINISCNKVLLWGLNALLLRTEYGEGPYDKLLSLFSVWAYFGCWWNTFQITSFRAIFLLFVYILKFVSFLLENEYGRFRLLRHTV